jgi:hypothetical protein
LERVFMCCFHTFITKSLKMEKDNNNDDSLVLATQTNESSL